MKLFLLEAYNNYYNKVYIRHVIKAESKESARQIAQNISIDNNSSEKIWIDNIKSKCVEIDLKGPEQVILSEFLGN